MKKIMAIATAAAIALALAGCGTSAPASSALSDADASVSSESAGASLASASSVIWTKTNDSKLAGREAGLDGFACPTDALELSVGKLEDDWAYCYTKGFAEGNSYADAAAIVVRKSKEAGDNTAELSEFTANWAALNDTTFAHQWDVDINDTSVTCYGNKEGTATKMIWNQNGYGYSVLALGQGETWADFGLNESDTKTLVEAVIKANANYKEAEEKIAGSSSAASTPAQDKDKGYNDVVKTAIANYGLGEYVRYSTYEDEYGNTIIEVVTRDTDGSEIISTLDEYGNLTESGYDETYYDSDLEYGYEDEESEDEDSELETDENTDETEEETTDETEDEVTDETEDEYTDETEGEYTDDSGVE